MQIVVRVFIQQIFDLETEQIKKLDPSFKKYRVRLLLLLYPWSSGILSTITSSYIKGVAELLKTNSFVFNLSNPAIYILLFLMVGTLVSQLKFMNMSLQYYNQLEVVPIYQSFVIMSNLMCACIIFNEFRNYAWQSLLLITIGTLICISGILVMMKKYTLVKTGSKVILLEPESL